MPDFSSIRQYWAAALAVCIGTVVSLAAFQDARQQATDRLMSELSRQAGLRAHGLDDMLSRYEGTIAGFASSFAAARITRAEFVAYAHNISLASRPLGTAFQSVGWEPRVSETERADFEAAARAEGFPDYRIVDAGRNGALTTAPTRKVYFPLRYIEPVVPASPMGLDVLAAADRGAAARRALERGAPAATAPLRLVVGGRGCIIYVPVFKPGEAASPAGAPSERVIGLLSFLVMTTAAIDTVMEALQPVSRGVDMYVLDDGTAPGDRLFYGRAAQTGGTVPSDGDASSVLVEPYARASFGFAGRNWTVVVRPTPASLATALSSSGWGELSLGLVLTGLLGAYLVSSRNRADRLRVLAQSLRQEIVERERAEEQISYSARHDFLTGLPNRMLFRERLRQEIARAKRGERSFAVLYLDLDRFKDINDTLGHQAGDDLLKGVAERLREAVRDIDTVARLGGDEFAIIQTGLRDPADAAVLAKKLLDLLHRPFILGEQEAHADASVGAAVFAPEVDDEDAVLVHADLAMYKAKAAGGGHYCFHLPEMEEEVRSRAALVDDLRTGVARGEFALHYQPQVDLAGGAILGMEALVRWQHPGRGLALPDAFLEEAERSGLIFELDSWALRAACRQGRAWTEAGTAPPLLSVNLSGATLKRGPQFLRLLEETLAETGFPAERLEIELSDGVFAASMHGQHETLREVRRMGMRLAINGFGSSYASLEFLRLFPVDRIKLARELISCLPGGQNESAIVATIVSLAAALRIRLVAVGIENVEQLQFLTSHGCTEGQGYYFGRPIGADDASALLRRGNLRTSLAHLPGAAATSPGGA